MPLNKIIKAELEAVAVKPEGYPEANMPEIALAGRSNVGKSSFLNALMNRRNLARTSSKPGKTRTINFYNINDELRMVDLPGYGYAAAAKSEMEAWAKYINTYLETREKLVAVFQLVDIRHEPSALDLDMYEYILHTGLSSIIIATKADKISRGQYQKHIKIIRDKLGANHDIIPFSSTKKDGLDEIRQIIDSIIASS